MQCGTCIQDKNTWTVCGRKCWGCLWRGLGRSSRHAFQYTYASAVSDSSRSPIWYGLQGYVRLVQVVDRILVNSCGCEHFKGNVCPALLQNRIIFTPVDDESNCVGFVRCMPCCAYKERFSQSFDDVEICTSESSSLLWSQLSLLQTSISVQPFWNFDPPCLSPIHHWFSPSPLDFIRSWNQTRRL